MTTPSARFVIGFDADTSGIDRSKAGVEGLRSTIDKGTKSLAEMNAAMARLKGTAEVTRWEALPKDIAKADNEIKKLEADMAKLKASFDKAPAGAAKDGLAAQFWGKASDLEKAKTRLGGLKAEQDKLRGSAPVKAFEDLKLASDKLKGTLGQNQVALSRLGGTMAKGEGALDKLKEGFDATGSPIGGLIGKFQTLKEVMQNPLAKAAAMSALAVAVVVGWFAIAGAITAAIVKVTAFAIQSADAARSVGLIREAAAVGSASAADLERAMLKVEGKTSATREAVGDLVNEYSRLRLTIGGIEAATSAVTVATQAAGQAAGAAIKGLIDRGVDTKRFWLGAFDLKGTGLARGEVAAQLAKQMKISIGAAENALRDGRVKLEDGIKALDAAVEARFGEVARRQMLALPVQLERAKKNLNNLFAGVKIEGFLEKLHDTLSLLDETTETGKAIRQVFSVALQPFVDMAGDGMPIVEGLIYGVVFSVQMLVIWGLKAAIALKGVFGGSSLLKNVDGMKLAFYAGAGAVGLVLGAVTALAGAFVLLGIVIGAALAPFILVAVQVVGLALTIGASFTALASEISELFSNDLLTDSIEDMIDGAVKGVKDGASKLWEGFKDLAKGAVDAFKGALGIASPSKVFRAESKWIPVGAAKGIEDGKPRVTQALATLAEPSAMGGAATGQAIAPGAEPRAPMSLTVNYYGPGTRSDAQRVSEVILDNLETGLLARGLALP